MATNDARQTYTDLKTWAGEVRSDIDRLQVELATATERYQRFHSAAKALEAVYPELIEVETEASDPISLEHKTNTVGTKGSVLDWLGRNPEQWFLIDAINKNIVDAGLLNGTYAENENRVRVATIRLAKEGKLESKKGHGRAHFYRIMSEGTA